MTVTGSSIREKGSGGEEGLTSERSEMPTEGDILEPLEEQGLYMQRVEGMFGSRVTTLMIYAALTGGGG